MPVLMEDYEEPEESSNLLDKRAAVQDDYSDVGSDEVEGDDGVMAVIPVNLDEDGNVIVDEKLQETLEALQRLPDDAS